MSRGEVCYRFKSRRPYDCYYSQGFSSNISSTRRGTEQTGGGHMTCESTGVKAFEGIIRPAVTVPGRSVSGVYEARGPGARSRRWKIIGIQFMNSETVVFHFHV